MHSISAEAEIFQLSLESLKELHSYIVKGQDKGSRKKFPDHLNPEKNHTLI